ncbi:hypothetical protein [Vibrio phage S4-7]|nr:hypothetical protein [Vibrio phage S4-7]
MENFRPIPLPRNAALKIGEVRGYLTVVDYGVIDNVKGYLLKCSCGKLKFEKRTCQITSGKTTSCGCSYGRRIKSLYEYRERNKVNLEKAGILYISLEQFSNDRIPHWCPVHNEYSVNSRLCISKFSVAPCFKCGKVVANKNKVKTTEQFIEDSKSVWGDVWDYERTVYTGSHNKLTITCRKHGDYQQTATDHLCLNVGCKVCSPRSGFDKSKDGSFYLVRWEHKLNGHEFIKFGVTNRSVAHRVNTQRTRVANIQYVPTVLTDIRFKDGSCCTELETLIKSEFETGVVNKEEFPDGFSETTYVENLNKVKLIVNQFLKENEPEYERGNPNGNE